MVKYIFSIERFKSQWESLTKEQRSPFKGSEIVLIFSEEAIHVGMAAPNGDTITLPWRYQPDEQGVSLLLEQWQIADSAISGIDGYMFDEAEILDELHSRSASYEQEDTSLKGLGIALLKTLALVGTGYMAYRTICR